MYNSFDFFQIQFPFVYYVSTSLVGEKEETMLKESHNHNEDKFKNFKIIF